MAEQVNKNFSTLQTQILAALNNGNVADDISGNNQSTDLLINGVLAGKANADHRHTSEHITDIIPISKGGTYATNPNDALTNLGGISRTSTDLQEMASNLKLPGLTTEAVETDTITARDVTVASQLSAGVIKQNNKFVADIEVLTGEQLVENLAAIRGTGTTDPSGATTVTKDCVTFVTNQCYAVRVGKLCFFHLEVKSEGVNGSPAVLKLVGLPFTPDCPYCVLNAYSSVDSVLWAADNINSNANLEASNYLVSGLLTKQVESETDASTGQQVEKDYSYIELVSTRNNNTCKISAKSTGEWSISGVYPIA